MIVRLRGTIQDKSELSVTVDVHDIGYRVFVPMPLLERLRINQTAEFFIHHHIREEAQELYGFATDEELEFFEQLLSISGIGPKSGLALLSLASVSDLKTAIVHGDPAVLTRVSGIGKKTAERVIVELKSKIRLRSDSDGAEAMLRRLEGSNAALQALTQLGYSRSEAEAALAAVDPKPPRLEDHLKAALQQLGTRSR